MTTAAPRSGWVVYNQSEASKFMSDRRVAVSISILFIVQVLTAAIGVSFVQSFFDGDPDTTALTVGALLMMFSGIVIAAIGVLLHQVLKFTNKRLVVWVPVIRSIECVVALVFGVYLLTSLQAVPNHLLWVYILAGAAGVILSYLLFAFKLVPRPIATLGFMGYAFLLLGVPLDFAGVIDMNEGLGQALFVPGALFELIVLPIWLIAKGFNLPALHNRECRGGEHVVGPGTGRGLPMMGGFLLSPSGRPEHDRVLRDLV